MINAEPAEPLVAPITPGELTRNLAWLRSKGVEITDEQAAMIQTCLAHGIELTNELAIIAQRVVDACERNWQEFMALGAR